MLPRQPIQIAAGQRMGALTRRAEGGGCGGVKNKIACVVVAQALPQLVCRLRFHRENRGQLAIVQILQRPISQYACGVDRPGNAAIARQLIENPGQLSGVANITTADADLHALDVARPGGIHARRQQGNTLRPFFFEPVNGKAAQSAKRAGHQMPAGIASEDICRKIGGAPWIRRQVGEPEGVAPCGEPALRKGDGA